ncbi:metallophosphoesterase family protein [Luteimonas sp. R10]|uniref:metallophosphoesterase family protein n=1 Tax=Luteimonas sp. R10 TaxID=3108176 RepID=UPI00308EDFE1|nr:metallophosphoesterase family protein [Luteimonas sp. R10]
MTRIGLVSDTHGLLRPEAIAFLRGSDHIVHAGDIGRPEILDALAALAPLAAIRGNIDVAAWAADVPRTLRVELAGVHFLVLHDRSRLDFDPAAAGIDVVVSGHSHKPLIERRAGVLYVNPGSAGPRRFKLPVTAAELLVSGGTVTPRIVDLLAA